MAVMSTLGAITAAGRFDLQEETGDADENMLQ